jgi:hypothetical protein
MARQITAGEWGRIIAHAWLDPNFANALSTDPAKAAKSFLQLDPSTEVNVFQVPAKPADLSQPQLEDIRNGKTASPYAAPYSC